jgi:hypothetical protein
MDAGKTASCGADRRVTPPADKLISDELLDELALVFARAAVENYLEANSASLESEPTHESEVAA